MRAGPMARERAERIKREFRRRLAFVMASWLPLVIAAILLLIESDSQRSVLEFLPGVRELTELQWILAWGAILLAALAFHAVIARIYFRCPACEKFIGRKWNSRHCPHCAARLQEGAVPRVQ